MSQDYDASAQRQWLDGLDEARLGAALATIARLPARLRRTVLANPLRYLQQEGLRPPAGIEIRLLDKELDPAGFPDLPQLPELPRHVHICFEICTLEPWIVNNEHIGLKQVCRLRCIFL